ncbi:MAG: HAMP domain-containing sensor histidine kinase [Nitriliruptoraceae bacterium]
MHRLLSGRDWHAPRDIDHYRRAERAFVAARFVVVLLIAAESSRFAAHNSPVSTTALLLGATLAALNVGVYLAVRVVHAVAHARMLALAAIVLDFALATSFVWLYVADLRSGHVLLYFLVVVQAAVKFELPGALVAWFVSAATYLAKELWVADVIGITLDVSWASYRLGIMLIIGIGMGFYARELAQAHAALTQAMREVRDGQQWRDAFVDMLAHDLRAPVGTTAAVSATLYERIDVLSHDEVRGLAGAINRQSQRALRLADDLLDLARIRAGRLVLRPQRVDVTALAASVVDLLDAEARPSVRIETPDAIVADVDRARAEQVLVNLVDNAVRHGVPPVRIRVVRVDDTIEVHVADHGPGVAADVRATLFDPLVTTREDGTGLGLWLARTLAEAQGGTVEYRHEPQPTFVFTLPVTAPNPTSPVEA